MIEDKNTVNHIRNLKESLKLDQVQDYPDLEQSWGEDSFLQQAHPKLADYFEPIKQVNHRRVPLYKRIS